MEDTNPGVRRANMPAHTSPVSAARLTPHSRKRRTQKAARTRAARPASACARGGSRGWADYVHRRPRCLRTWRTSVVGACARGEPHVVYRRSRVFRGDRRARVCEQRAGDRAERRDANIVAGVQSTGRLERVEDKSSARAPQSTRSSTSTLTRSFVICSYFSASLFVDSCTRVRALPFSTSCTSSSKITLHRSRVARSTTSRFPIHRAKAPPPTGYNVCTTMGLHAGQNTSRSRCVQPTPFEMSLHRNAPHTLIYGVRTRRIVPRPSDIHGQSHQYT
jgi:hypothetical protein